MNRSDRLKRVAEHFGEDRDAASRKLADLRTIVDQAEARLEDLREYLASYRDELEQTRRAGTTSAKLQNYSAFMSQLQVALQQQERQVQKARSAFEWQMDVWSRARMQVRAVEQAAERRVRVERKELERTEQRQLDELSLNRFLGARK